MATASPPTGQPAAQHLPFGMRVQNFWRRVTEGLEVSQLWSQFESEARASYRLYSKDVAAKTPEGLTDRGRHLHVVKEFFWAVFEKLSPARRVLLLLALVLIVIPHGGFEYTGQAGKVYVVEFDLHFWAALVLLLLLMLEIADRVVMKRDLQIAQGDPDVASARCSSADTRPGARLHDASRQYRCRRLLRRLPAARQNERREPCRIGGRRRRR